MGARKPGEGDTDLKRGKRFELRPVEEDTWFEDRQHMQAFSNHAESDGESIWLLSYADMMTLLFGFFVMISSFSKLDTETFDKVRKQATSLFGGEYKQAAKPAEKLSDDFTQSGITDKALLQDNEKGDIVITFRGSVFFETAATEIKPEAVAMLTKVIKSIQRQPVRYRVIVEGHTDDVPISQKYPSNWELSSVRASSVLRIFEQNGFDRSLLAAVGYADSRPVLPNRDAKGKSLLENQNQNRRVVIKLIRAD